MLQIFKDSANLAAHVSNEQIYDIYLAKLLRDYGQSGQGPAYFERLFAGLDSFAKSNAKTFSQLKHLSYELSGLLAKTGETLHRIAAVYGEFMLTTEEFNKKVQFQADPNVVQISKKLQLGLSEWGSQLIAQKTFVIDNMAGFFHFKKHEYLELSKLVLNKIDLNSQYKRRLQTLEDKKAKLFNSKDVDKWRVDFSKLREDFNELMKSYPRIKPHMLPEVSSAGDGAARAAQRGQPIP